MSTTVIKVENLSKKFLIHHEERERYIALRDVISNKAKSIFRRNDRSVKGAIDNKTELFWALKELNFEISKGDRVGIIGRNGAGKSTLLKVLSRITEPTIGKVTIRGRIASLLEVGTGFHPELTGRENIFLNGAILGMSRAEIKTKFNEIVEFAEIEKFLDTPVKRYSSGMYVRLAFAVAAHLEPEILIVDEVLAVGDAQFQRKCLGKLEDVSKNDGRTVLFVSHNMQAISSLTNRCLLLQKGQLIKDMETSSAIVEYVKNNQLTEGSYALSPDNLISPRILKASLETSLPNSVHVHNEPFSFSIAIFTPRSLSDAAISIQIFNQYDVAVTHFWLFDSGSKLLQNKTGRIELRCEIPNLKLFMGQYKCTIYFSEHAGSTRLETLKDVCSFEVVMYGHQRDHEWQEGSSVYLDSFNWQLI
jgi:lipopolysaccharide transport system ATP-binding protein